MAEEFVVVTSNTCHLLITSSQSGISTEKRFQKSLTIGELKGRLELLTGLNHTTMKLELYDKTKTFIAHLEGDELLLGSFPAEDGMTLLVIGKGPVDDAQLSKVEKLTLSEEEYSKRGDTLRSYLIRNKLGQYSEDSVDAANANDEKTKKKAEEEEEELMKSMVVGSRCQVTLTGQPEKRGTVKYVGKVHFKAGQWVGVEYDEPLGKNDGSVEGKCYFTCPPKYGAFIKPQFVTVGDFPEEDITADDEM